MKIDSTEQQQKPGWLIVCDTCETRAAEAFACKLSLIGLSYEVCTLPADEWKVFNWASVATGIVLYLHDPEQSVGLFQRLAKSDLLRNTCIVIADYAARYKQLEQLLRDSSAQAFVPEIILRDHEFHGPYVEKDRFQDSDILKIIAKIAKTQIWLR